ncbi:MAG: hypothetical protein ABIL68_15835 [bacterium]
MRCRIANIGLRIEENELGRGGDKGSGRKERKEGQKLEEWKIGRMEGRL